MYLRTSEEGLAGERIFLDMVSIGATINVMLAAVKAKGKTIIENAAREPEIIDVATLLNNMGAKIRGAGTNEIRIEGVQELHGCRHSIIPDRIEAGTYLSLAAAAGEGITIKNVIYEHLESYIAKLEEIGVRMDISEDEIYVYPSKDLKPANVKTYPYPGFATDLQQPITPFTFESKWHVRNFGYNLCKTCQSHTRTCTDGCASNNGRQFDLAQRTEPASWRRSRCIRLASRSLFSDCWTDGYGNHHSLQCRIYFTGI